MLVFIREIGRHSRGHCDVLQSSYAMPDHVSTEQPLNIFEYSCSPVIIVSCCLPQCPSESWCTSINFMKFKSVKCLFFGIFYW